MSITEQEDADDQVHHDPTGGGIQQQQQQQQQQPLHNHPAPPPPLPRPPPPPPPFLPSPRHIPPPPPPPQQRPIVAAAPLQQPAPQQQQAPPAPQQQPSEEEEQEVLRRRRRQAAQQEEPQRRQHEKAQEEEDAWQPPQQRQQRPDWTLHLAVDIPQSVVHPAEQMRNNNNNNYMILRIHVTADMDANMLSRCIQQACSGVWQQAGSNSGLFFGGSGNNNSSTIVGLFAQESRIFVSLHHLLQQAANNSSSNDRQWQKQVYWLRLPPIPVAPRKVIPWYRLHAPYILGILSIVVMSIMIQDQHVKAAQESLVSMSMLLQDSALNTVQTLQHHLIEWPLHDLYRHGPWFVGWEGDDLSRICARITFHGDASFWAMNTAECARIYDGKLQAFLRLSRPILITFYVLVVLFLLRCIWWEVQRHAHFRKQQQQYRAPAPPADMVETYQAFQTLLRQVQRTLAPSAAAAQNANDYPNQQPPQQRQQRR